MMAFWWSKVGELEIIWAEAVPLCFWTLMSIDDNSCKFWVDYYLS